MILFNNFFLFSFFFFFYGISLAIFPLIKTKLSAKFYTAYNVILLLLQNFFLVCSGFSVFYRDNTYTTFSHMLSTFNDIVVNGISLTINPLSFYFSLLVLLIGCATNLYVLSYFRNEADELSFSFWLNFFIFSMLVLVFSSNFYTLFLGWELIGLTSFFLINFWTSRRGTLKSSFKAFSFNLISDVFLLASLVCFYYATRVTHIDQFLYLVLWGGLQSPTLLITGLICLTICASIKSVQLLGHLWLPDSMEAPVPASSLIHSATLVSAGIYLLLKFNLLYQVYDLQNFLLVWGSVTAMYGGIVAATQTDMKKLLAYSTMSHCGFLWVLAVSGNFYITILYLFLHGFFKATTFYCSGNFIRVFNSQDTRYMGAGYRVSHFDTFLLLVCASNLAGLPLTVGFLYKTFFFSILMQGGFGFLIVINLIVAALTSVIYFFRLTYYVTFDYYKGYAHVPTLSILQVEHKYITENTTTPLNHIFAVCFIILASAVSVYFFSWVLCENIQPFSFIGEVTNQELTVFNGGTLYFSYFLYFYYTYIAFIFTLTLVAWRPSLLKYELILFIIYILFILINDLRSNNDRSFNITKL